MNAFLIREESNRGLQVIAVLMAITLWIFVGLLPRMDTDRRKLTLDVKVKNAPGSMALKTVPAMAELVLVGPKGTLAKIGDQDLEVFVDLKQRGAVPGSPLPLSVSGPPGVRWEVSPNTVLITPR